MYNNASSAGGFAVEEATSAVIDSCLVVGNTATTSGVHSAGCSRSGHGGGGGVCFNIHGPVVLSNTHIQDNTAVNGGRTAMDREMVLYAQYHSAPQ